MFNNDIGKEMTREEQIKKAADKFQREFIPKDKNNERFCFIAGVLWSESHPINVENQKHSVIEYTYYRAYSDALLWVLENVPSRKEVMKRYEYHKGVLNSTIEKGE